MRETVAGCLRRISITGVTLALSISVVGSATAATPSSDDCARAYAQGQEFRLSGRAYEAYEQFELCAQSSCPSVMSQDCARWSTLTQHDLPSIDVRIVDSDGNEIAGVTIELDGETLPVTQSLSGLLVDVGRHRLTARAPGYAEAVWEDLLLPQDKNRSVVLTLLREAASSTESAPAPPRSADAAKAAPTRPVAEPPSRIAPLVVGATGIASLGVAAYFGIRAKEQYDELERECAPGCSQSAVDSLDRKMLVSDIALGAGVVFIAGAAVWLLSSRTTSKDAKSSATLAFVPSARLPRASLELRF